MRSANGRLVTMSAPVSIPHNNVLAVFEDAEQNVWVGTQGGMLRLQPGAANTVTPIDGAPLSINTIYQDPRGPVFVAALDGRLFQVARHTLVPVDLPPPLAGLVVRNVFRDSKGRLWIGTDGQGIARIDGSTVAQVHDEGRARQRLRAGLLRRSRGRRLDWHRRRTQLLAQWDLQQLHAGDRSHLRQHPRVAARSTTTASGWRPSED